MRKKIIVFGNPVRGKSVFADIHSLAAARMFNKALKDVTPEERKRAKAENFRRMYSAQFVRTVNYDAQASHADINRRIQANYTDIEIELMSPPHSVEQWIDDFLYAKGRWHLDTHSTILSRKTSFHKMKGKLRYVKPRHVKSTYGFKYYYRHTLNWMRTLVFLPPLPPKTLRSTVRRINTNPKTGELEHHSE